MLGNAVLVSSGLHMRKVSPKIIHYLVARHQKLSPVLSQAERSLKNVGLKWQQIISLPGAPTYPGPA